MYEVLVEHCSLEAGKVGQEMMVGYREPYRNARAAAFALLAQIEGGTHVPAGRHGYYFVVDGLGCRYALNTFAAIHKIKLPKDKGG